MHAIDVFATYAAKFRDEVLSPDVIHHAKRAVIDWYASVFAGLDTPAVHLLEHTLLEDVDRGQARLVNGRSATARSAAMINATAAHAAEVDDTFRDAMYHPGAATIASALAAAHTEQTNGMQFLRGVVLGYEVSTRIGVVLGRHHYKYWHSTGTVGSFGAAAAAGGVYGLDALPFAHALSTVATFAAGLQQAFRMDSMSKPLHAGRAAEAGLLAAQLARNGITGSRDVLDGEVGMGDAMSNHPDWSQIGATLGKDFHITRITFKNHVGCGHAFAAIDGALALRAQHHITASEIAAVRVGTYQVAISMACHENPTTTNESLASIHYMVATALVHGSVRLDAHQPRRLSEPVTRALMQRITVAVAPDLDARFPNERAARVEIDTVDGRHLTYLQQNRKGDPEDPLSDPDLDEKFTEFVAPVIGAERAGALLAKLWSADAAPSMDWSSVQQAVSA